MDALFWVILVAVNAAVIVRIEYRVAMIRTMLVRNAITEIMKEISQ